MKKIFLVLLILTSITSLLILYFSLPVSSSTTKKTILLNSERGDVAALALQDEKLIKSFTMFNIIYSLIGERKVTPGAYNFSENMNLFEIVIKLNEGPDMLLISFPEGLRKEQIGERLAKLFNWNESELTKWNNEYTNFHPDYTEGVYFPDTYLIPVDESGEQIAKRMISNFNNKFKPYQIQFENKNIKWTTALKIASLLEREAGSYEDMPIISGIIWNRLERGEKLDIDATIQYAKGKTKNQWWSRINGEDIKNIDSPFNTYKHKGLPPTPISNPGIKAIEAVLNPEDTDCLFYLHDRNREIHCSVTYSEHLDNIEKYLN